MADTPELSRQIRRLEIKTTRLVANIFGGEYHSVFKGRGMDFDEVREYQDGDDVRHIDWNVTARMDRMFVKRFVEERELTVLLAVDVSASLGFGSRDRLKVELAAEFAAAIALSAMQNHDRVGLFLFSDSAERFIPPKRGRPHALRVIRDVLTHRPEGTRTDYAASLSTLHRVQKGRCVIFLLSDFLDLEFGPALKGLASRHDVIAVTLVDPRELELPAVGLIEVVDPESRERLQIDSSDARVRSLYRRNAAEHAASRSAAFRSLGLDELVLRTDRGMVRPLLEFFQHRANRLVRRRRGAS